jgi:hypothetical protein
MSGARGLVVWEQEEEAEDGELIGLRRQGAEKGTMSDLVKGIRS